MSAINKVHNNFRILNEIDIKSALKREESKYDLQKRYVSKKALEPIFKIVTTGVTVAKNAIIAPFLADYVIEQASKFVDEGHPPLYNFMGPGTKLNKRLAVDFTYNSKLSGIYPYNIPYDIPDYVSLFHDILYESYTDRLKYIADIYMINDLKYNTTNYAQIVATEAINIVSMLHRDSLFGDENLYGFEDKKNKLYIPKILKKLKQIQEDYNNFLKSIGAGIEKDNDIIYIIPRLAESDDIIKSKYIKFIDNVNEINKMIYKYDKIKADRDTKTPNITIEIENINKQFLYTKNNDEYEYKYIMQESISPTLHLRDKEKEEEEIAEEYPTLMRPVVKKIADIARKVILNDPFIDMMASTATYRSNEDQEKHSILKDSITKIADKVSDLIKNDLGTQSLIMLDDYNIDADNMKKENLEKRIEKYKENRIEELERVDKAKTLLKKKKEFEQKTIDAIKQRKKNEQQKKTDEITKLLEQPKLRSAEQLPQTKSYNTTPIIKHGQPEKEIQKGEAQPPKPPLKTPYRAPVQAPSQQNAPSYKSPAQSPESPSKTPTIKAPLPEIKSDNTNIDMSNKPNLDLEPFKQLFFYNEGVYPMTKTEVKEIVQKLGKALSLLKNGNISSVKKSIHTMIKTSGLKKRINELKIIIYEEALAKRITLSLGKSPMTPELFRSSAGIPLKIEIPEDITKPSNIIDNTLVKKDSDYYLPQEESLNVSTIEQSDINNDTTGEEEELKKDVSNTLDKDYSGIQLRPYSAKELRELKNNIDRQYIDLEKESKKQHNKRARDTISQTLAGYKNISDFIEQKFQYIVDNEDGIKELKKLIDIVGYTGKEIVLYDQKAPDIPQRDIQEPEPIDPNVRPAEEIKKSAKEGNERLFKLYDDLIKTYKSMGISESESKAQARQTLHNELLGANELKEQFDADIAERDRRPFYFMIGDDVLREPKEKRDLDIKNFSNFNWLSVNGSDRYDGGGDNNKLFIANQVNDSLRFNNGLYIPPLPYKVPQINKNTVKKMKAVFIPDVLVKQALQPAFNKATPGRIVKFSNDNPMEISPIMRKNGLSNSLYHPDRVDGIIV